jgi:hypothetical protein
MGYRDFPMMLSDSQAVGADANSTNFLDTELTIPGWERGQPAAVVVTVETAPGGTTGVQFIVVHKTSEPTVNDANLVTVRVLNADLVAGDQIVIPLPGGVKLLRYVRLYYDLIAADETSGVFSAYFTATPLHSSP